jgi:hypothetical protein
MEPCRRERSGLYRPVVPARVPRDVPDEEFNALFAALGLAPGPGAGGVLCVHGGAGQRVAAGGPERADPGRQLITVVRKGTRAVQPLPAPADAFVWLRLYQVQMDGLLPRGSGLPLWWTLRRPFRPLGYHAAHRMCERAPRSPAPAPRCIRCATLRPAGWPPIRRCRSPTSSSFWAMRC